MTGDFLVIAEVRIPLDRIVDAVGPEIQRKLIGNVQPRLKVRPQDVAVKVSVERVVAALDHLEIATNTSGERPAREALMHAVRGLRKAHVKNRSR